MNHPEAIPSAPASPVPLRDHLDALRCDAFAAAIPFIVFLFHLLTARGYGFFRDELYYLASTEHPDFGYVEHPPLVVIIAWLTRSLLGDSISAVRFFPALAAGITVYLAAAITRQLGGGRSAQLLASVAVALAPGYIGLFSVFSMNAFDIFFWTLAVLVVVRLLKSGDPRLWILFGIVCGAGLQNKISIGFLAFGIVAGLFLSSQWWALTNRWIWFGGVIALLLFAPYLWWQTAHGWPTLEFMHNAATQKNVSLSIPAFLGEQALQMNPVALPLWFGGLIFLLFSNDARRFRTLGWAYLAILGLMLTQNAKPYYLVPAYPMLFAAGSLLLEQKTRRLTGVLSAALLLLVVSGMLLAPFAKALLDVETFVRYANTLGMKPRTEERQVLGRLPQHFADMHGWPEMAAAVAGVYRGLPAEEQSKACVFGQNYGEAGAIDFFGRALGLPGAISGHNSYFLWGPGKCTGELLLVIGDRREVLEGIFESVEEGGRFACQDCMPYENNRPIWICRRMRRPLQEFWPQVKKFI